MFIGSFFESLSDERLNETTNSIHNYFEAHNSMNLVYLNDGRQCIELILRALSNFETKNYYVPYFNCQSILQPYIQNSLDYKFYSNRLLSNFTTNFSNLEVKDVLLIIDYWGAEFIKNETIENLLNRGVIVIIDITQTTLNSSRISLNHENLFIFSSLRKTLAIPDGGLLIYNSKYQCEKYFNKKRSQLTDKTINLMNLKKLTLEQSIGQLEIQDELFNLYMEIEEIENYKNSNLIEPFTISEISFNIIQHLDLPNLLQKRWSNLNYLYNHIDDQFHLVSRDELVSPFYFIMKFNNKEKRDVIRSKLIENNVFSPIHWTYSKSAILKDDQKLSELILSLPIDQRYTLTHMDYIAEVIDSSLYSF